MGMFMKLNTLPSYTSIEKKNGFMYFVGLRGGEHTVAYSGVCVWVLNEPVREKTNNLGSDQVRHKPDCTVTEDGYRLENLDLESISAPLSSPMQIVCFPMLQLKFNCTIPCSSIHIFQINGGWGD